MALTPSTMLPLGTTAPDFSLPDAKTGDQVSLASVAGPRGTLVVFICNHCPFVKHIEPALVSLGQDYQDSGITIIAINSNDVVSQPEDAPEQMAKKAYPFSYLFDETQQVAKAYDAACTPDIYLFDRALRLVYRGQFDDSRPGNDIPVTGADLRAAMDALLAGVAVTTEQKPSIGCNIKWRDD